MSLPAHVRIWKVWKPSKKWKSLRCVVMCVLLCVCVAVCCVEAQRVRASVMPCGVRTVLLAMHNLPQPITHHQPPSHTFLCPSFLLQDRISKRKLIILAQRNILSNLSHPLTTDYTKGQLSKIYQTILSF